MTRTPHRDGRWLGALGRTDTELDPQQLTAVLQDLLSAASPAVPSCLAVSLTLYRHAQPVTFTAMNPGARQVPVRSSMALQLPRHPPPPEQSDDLDDLGDLSARAGNPVLVLYAGQAAALHHPAAELLALLGLPTSRVSLDSHLQLPDQDQAGALLRTALAELSTVDQALGVLLDRGLIPSQARDALDALAAAANISLVGAAQVVLRPTPPSPTAADPPVA